MFVVYCISRYWSNGVTSHASFLTNPPCEVLVFTADKVQWSASLICSYTVVLCEIRKLLLMETSCTSRWSVQLHIVLHQSVHAAACCVALCCCKLISAFATCHSPAVQQCGSTGTHGFLHQPSLMVTDPCGVNTTANNARPSTDLTFECKSIHNIVDADWQLKMSLGCVLLNDAVHNK